MPNRVQRLKALGNTVVPEIPYRIGLAILEYERQFLQAAFQVVVGGVLVFLTGYLIGSS